MKKVYFEKRYSRRRIEIRLSDELFKKLTTHKKYNPYGFYVHDMDAYYFGEKTWIFSPNQLRRLENFEVGYDTIRYIIVDGIYYDCID